MTSTRADALGRGPLREALLVPARLSGCPVGRLGAPVGQPLRRGRRVVRDTGMRGLRQNAFRVPRSNPGSNSGSNANRFSPDFRRRNITFTSVNV